MRNESKRKTMIEWLSLSGVISLAFYIMHDFIGGLYYPGYDRLTQAVSDLTATDAPSRIVAGGLSAAYGLFSCLCVALASIIVSERKSGRKSFRIGIYLFAAMTWISGVGYSLFPLSTSGYAGSFTDIMHLYVVTGAVVSLSIASLILIAVGGMKTHKTLAVIAIAVLGCMFVGVIGTGLLPDYFGIVERFSTYGAVLFTAVLGLYGFFSFKKPVII